MKDSDFVLEVREILNYIAEVIETDDQEGLIDIDLSDGILTIANEDGTYVINKQTAVKEIWLSSPISGPYHFIKKDGRWVSRGGDELGNILTKELKFNFEI